MILDKVEIKNFRSIKDVTISFKNKGLILIGKNEAGKSNVLKSIAALFGEYNVSNKDKRKRIQNETIDSYYIRGIFKLSDDDKQKIKGDLENEYKNVQIIEFENSDDTPVIQRINEKGKDYVHQPIPISEISASEIEEKLKEDGYEIIDSYTLIQY